MIEEKIEKINKEINGLVDTHYVVLNKEDAKVLYYSHYDYVEKQYNAIKSEKQSLFEKLLLRYRFESKPLKTFSDYMYFIKQLFDDREIQDIANKAFLSEVVVHGLLVSILMNDLKTTKGGRL